MNRSLPFSHRTFAYPSELRTDLLRARRRRAVFLCLIFLPFGIGAVAAVISGQGLVWLLMIPFIGAICAAMHFLLAGIEANAINMANHVIELNGFRLRQIDDAGVIVGEVDLDGDYTAGFKHHAAGHATYTVASNASAIRFTTHIQGAEFLVRDALQQDWPPGGDPGG